MNHDFEADWRRAFGASPPLKHQLWIDHSLPWVRFHALPHSKRYPDDNAELAIVLDRANALLEACFGPAGRLWIVMPLYQTSWKTEEQAQIGFADELGLATAMRWRSTDRDAVEGWVRIAVGKHCAQPGSFDRLFQLVALEEIEALIFDPLSRRLLSPYDGGFDLCLESSAQVDEFNRRFYDWVPSVHEAPWR